MEKNWPPLYKYRCKKCGDTLQSKWPGQFVQCSCKSMYLDQTEYYTRIGGDMEDIEEIKNDSAN